MWPGINKYVCEWARTCSKCQTAKVHGHVAAPLGTFLSPDALFDICLSPSLDHWRHLTVFGPIRCHRLLYLLARRDSHSRYPSRSDVAPPFVAHWISPFGVPSAVTTDLGAQFESSLFSILSPRLGIHRIRTTTCHLLPMA